MPNDQVSNIIVEPVGPWPPIKFAISASDGAVARALFILVSEASSGTIMWQVAPESAVHPSGEVASSSRPQPVLLADDEAETARTEFASAIKMLAQTQGVQVQTLTYGEVPVGMREQAPASPLQIGHSYTLAFVGNGNAQHTFTA